MDGAKWYRRLIKLYPARFREEYETPLENDFRDDYRESRGGARFWFRTIVDFLKSAPLEFFREIAQDLRFSVRVYRKRPVVTMLAIAALAMAIGATTGVFSVVNALLFRSLPFREPEQLVQFSQFPLVQSVPGGFGQWRTHTEYLEDAAAYSIKEMNLNRESDSIRAKVVETTANFFTLMGTEPDFGRGFAAGEDQPGKNGVAVISYALWQQFFGGDPKALGSVIRLNGSPATVIGVARARMDFPDRAAVWTPTALDSGRIEKTGVTFFNCLGRLRKGLTLAAATEMMRADLQHMYPRSDYRKKLNFVPLRERLTGPVVQASLVMMGSGVFVLVIACANLANLLLARVAERRQELAVRAALGASRARLVQQLMTESVVLSAIGAGAGLAIANWVARLAAGVQPAAIGTQEYTILDWRVLGFTAGLSLLTGIAFGVFPAWLSSRQQPGGDEIYSRARDGTRRLGRARQTLIAMQVAMTLALLAGSIVMGRSFLKLMGMDLGFRADHVVTMGVSLAGTHNGSPAAMRAYTNQALERLRAVPGVEQAGIVNYLPLDGDYFSPTYFQGEGGIKIAEGREVPFAMTVVASTGYFRAMDAKMLYGRDFTAADGPGTEPVVVVNEEFARQAGEGASLLGRKIKTRRFDREVTIVGVASTIRYAFTSGVDSPQMYFSSDQSPSASPAFIARVRGNPGQYIAVCRDAVASADREIPVFNAGTLDHRVEQVLARPRFFTTAVVFFGAFAMLLAIIGIYGVAAYSVALRKHEIGVRIAVGATAAAVRRMILLQGLWPVVVGMAIGLGVASGIGRYLEHLITGAQPASAQVCAAAAFTLAATAAIATWSATRRVSRMDPMVVLRSE